MRTKANGEQTAKKKRPNPWLRHVNPNLYPPRALDPVAESIQIKLEHHVGSLLPLMNACGLYGAEATSAAANIVAEQAMAVQREHSPDGQASMLAAMMGGDPIAEPLRAELWRLMRRRERNAVNAGILIGALGGAFIAWMAFT